MTIFATFSKANRKTLCMKKIIIAIDSFKGCLTSREANQAATEGILAKMADAEVVQVPVSDGGEGFMEAFYAAIGGKLVEVNVKDPLMRNITAQYLLKDDTAVIEIAQASGLTLLSQEERNPMRASSYGTGQLIADAVRRRAKHIIVGLGGSATSDCGIGMLRAIIDTFGQGGLWDDISQLHDVRFTIASDVNNPLCGENGAAYVFAPQKFAVKGAPTEMIMELDARARRFAEKSALHFGYDRQDMPGAGAAGGLGYAFLQYMNAECRRGIDLLLDTIGFDSLLDGASLVITGEGSADRQTLMGKLPFGILQRAKSKGIPTILIAGRVSDREQLLQAGFSHVECINPPGLPLEEAIKSETAKENIRNVDFFVEHHPLEPFLPENARVLFLGSFPPQRKRWCMEFYYPNFINDHWRIEGEVFFGDKNRFVSSKQFDREAIVAFCREKGIAFYDTATAVRRLKDNASDEFLEVVKPTDIRALLAQLPHCEAIVTTGQKATDTLCRYFGINVGPKVGESIVLNCDGHELRLYRLPSSSRAYPLAFDKKVAAYRKMFEAVGLI